MFDLTASLKADGFQLDNKSEPTETAATIIKAQILGDELRALGLAIGSDVCETIIHAIEKRFAQHCNSRQFSGPEADAISKRSV
jgi:hypothetical protein